MDTTLRKVLIYGSIILVAIALAILIPSLVWRRPNHHNEEKWGVIHIQMDNTWSQHHLEVAQDAMSELNRLGPTFVIGGSGDRNVRVVSVDLTKDGVSGHCDTTLGIAGFVTDQLTHKSHIEIDPTCASGDPEFRAALIHEVGHYLGMQHICQVSDTSTKNCSVVGRGIAVMNPNIAVRREDSLTWSADVIMDSPFPCSEIQAIDVKEFDRVHPLGHL